MRIVISKIKAVLALVVAIASIMSSCEERPTGLDTSLSVGNILLSDNTIISPSGYDKTNQTGVGIIFYTSADTVLVVGTRELGKFIYADSLGTISNVNNDSHSLCGTENTAAIMSSGIKSPAVNAVNAFKSPVSGWSLPSAGELRQLSQNIQKVRAAMAVVGGDAFSVEQYLSSSQDGSSTESEKMYYYSVSLTNGFVTSTNKQVAHNVRPILRLR
jgi:hypothetical protein